MKLSEIPWKLKLTRLGRIFSYVSIEGEVGVGRFNLPSLLLFRDYAGFRVEDGGSKFLEPFPSLSFWLVLGIPKNQP